MHMKGKKNMNGYPRMIRIRQRFEAPVVRDVARKIREELGALNLEQRIKSGDTVAIPAGSRGIADIATILKTVVERLREIGARPFVVPAMGSHGGGTAKGQKEVLRHYGITETRMGVPIRASMEVIKLGETPGGFPVHLDRHAAQADHIAVINRVKPHTEYYGEIESGLVKMITIGLGKRHGAEIYHKVAIKHPFSEVAQAVAQVVLRERSVLFGLGVVENGYEQTACIRAAGPEGLIALDKALLREAKRLMPRLPFDEIDVLIVDEIGPRERRKCVRYRVGGFHHAAVAGEDGRGYLPVECAHRDPAEGRDDSHGVRYGSGGCGYGVGYGRGNGSSGGQSSLDQEHA
jgi:hypothetical protein